METDLIEFMTEQLGGKEAVAKAYATRPRPLHVQINFPPDLAARILKETALDLGAAGPDNSFGYGRIDLNFST